MSCCSTNIQTNKQQIDKQTNTSTPMQLDLISWPIGIQFATCISMQTLNGHFYMQSQLQWLISDEFFGITSSSLRNKFLQSTLTCPFPFQSNFSYHGQFCLVKLICVFCDGPCVFSFVSVLNWIDSAIFECRIIANFASIPLRRFLVLSFTKALTGQLA